MLSQNSHLPNPADESRVGMPIPEKVTAVGQGPTDYVETDQDATILLVDDRDDKLLALETVLAELGQKVVLARSGAEALRLLLQQSVAVIVLDVNMPGMDGFETAALIRQRQNFELTPIIFISAVNYAETHLARGYSLGAVDYIMSPIVPEIFRAKVSFFVELYKKTEQLRQQAEIRSRLAQAEAARARAEAANSAKDRFFAILSHELRTPLTSILFCASTLSTDANLPEYARKDLEGLVRNVLLEARLIDDLLDIARINQGKFKLILERVDAHALLDAAIGVCAEEIAGRNLRLHRELNATHADVFGDSARLTQLFWNLLNNAAKFTPPGGEITVRTSTAEGSLLIQVIDSGIGIDRAALPKIFNPFEQIQPSQSGGLGLGLAISKAIIEQHNGNISASSEGLGRGTTFAVQLPAITQRPQRESAVALVPGPIPPDEGETRKHILLVDDHPDTANALKIFLSRAGYTVVLAPDVQTALQCVEKQTFGLLLCDLGLPDGRGEDLLQSLRQNGYKFPAVAVSGFGSEEDIARARAAGFHTHLTKPVHPDRLKSAIEEALLELPSL
jgi:signal transduction histidine kinase